VLQFQPSAAPGGLAALRRRFDVACRFGFTLGPLLILLLAVWFALVSNRAQAWDAQQMRAAAQRAGPAAVAAITPLQALLNRGVGQDDASRLLAVNEFFNLRIDFNSDQDVWGQPDYWATPMQSLAAGRGDCEDYVIAKYTVLLAMGVSRQRLRLVYVRARLPDEPALIAHMVLAYYATPMGEPLLLDNLRADVLPASQRNDLTPVFSFNSEGLWQGVGQSTAGDPMARLSRWRDTWQRIQQEGFF
jgi:predicted transglutaminase-like cysteine proteinase